jgi:hypothetical protein
MPAYIVAPEAEEDIFQIWSYLVKEAGAPDSISNIGCGARAIQH